MSKQALIFFFVSFFLISPLLAQVPQTRERHERHEIEPGWLGVALETVDENVTVSRVLPGSPALQAGIAEGDVITRLNDIEITTTQVLIAQVGIIPAGSRIQLQIAGPNPRIINVLLGVRVDPSEIVRGFVGTTFPEMTLHNARTSEPFSLPPAPGKITVIDFWATWCGFCVQSIPEVTALQNRFPDELSVIAIAPESIETLQQFDAQFSYLSLADPEELASSELWILSIPAWMLLDENNQIIGTYSGGQFEQLENDVAAAAAIR